MREIRWAVTVIIPVTLVLLFSASGLAAPLTLQADSGISLSEPKVALTKFASLFVNDLVTDPEEDLLHIRVGNPNTVAVDGTFFLSLTYNGRQLGYLKTDPVPLPPGESIWNLRTGDAHNELIVDVVRSWQDGASRQEILNDVNDSGEWGTVTKWSLRDWYGDEAWLKRNVFDWDSVGDLDDAGLLELIETIRALQFPAGTYTLSIELTSKDPESGVTTKRTSNVTWRVTNPEAVRLLFPDSEALDYPAAGIPVDELEFRWRLPELPDGFAATSKLKIQDRVTGRVESIDITHSDFDYNAEFTYGDDLGETLPELVTGRRYTWSVNLVGDLSRRTVGGAVPEATFWLENQPPLVSLSVPKVHYIAGDRTTVTATYHDDGDPHRNLAVQWYVDGDPIASGVDRIGYTFPVDLDGETEYVVRVEVTDSFGAVGVAELTLVAAPNQAPVVSIATPVDGGLYRRGEVIRFQAGDLVDPEGEGLRRIEWFIVAANAKADGRRIGTGESINFKLNTPQERKVTLLAEDVRGAVSRAVAFINVLPNRPPVVSIESPTAGRFERGAEIALSATVHDDFDSDDYDFGLRFEVNGEEVTTGTYTLTRTGSYRVRAIATDSDGAVGDAQVVVHAENPRAANSSKNQTPTVTLSGAPQEMRTGETFAVNAVAVDPDGQIVRIEWLINGESATETLLAENDTVLNLGGLGVGAYNIIVSAIDDVGAVGSDSVNLTVVQNLAPVFSVRGLQSGYLVGDVVQFAIEARDPDGDGLRGDVGWRVSGPTGREVALRNGGSVAFRVEEPGTYTLVMSAVDSLGLTGTHSISIPVVANSLPSVTINEPVSGSVVRQGDHVAIAVRITDPDGEAIEQILLNGEPLADFEQDGEFVRFVRAATETGPMTITIGAVDSRGGVGSASVTLMVSANGSEEGGVNTSPSLTLVGPPSDSVPFGVAQSFTATVSDPDLVREGTKEEVVVTWRVNGETVALSTESPYVLDYAFTSAGENQIEAIAVDMAGDVARAAVAVSVAENTAPRVAIEHPAPGATLPYGQPITLSSLASDAEGHGVSVTWLLDGQPIASGSSVQVTLTNAGAHRLTVRARDAYGAMNEMSIQVTIAAPEGELLQPAIIEPMDNQTVIADEALRFVASNVPNGATVVWRSSLTGEIAGSLNRLPGGEVRLTGELEAGEHVISLLVDGIQRDQVTVTVFDREEQSGAPQGIATVVHFADVDGSGVEVRRGGGANSGFVMRLRNVDDLGFEFQPGHFVWLDPGESIEMLIYDDSVGDGGLVQIANPSDASEALRVNVTQTVKNQ